MTFREFVFKNTIRNKNLYLAYFLSTLTTVMTFFTFSVFAFHPAIANDLQSAVKTGMMVASSIIYIFSFFYVLYSMDIFLQSRKKEFGLLLIQGMSPRQLRKMVFQENTIIGFLATLVGIGIGTLFSQVILWISKVTMHIDLGFYLPVKAMGVTFVSFLLLFFLISIFIQFKIPKMDVQELLKSQDLGKGELKASPIQATLAVILLVVGYGIAITVKGIAVVTAMLPVIVIVIVGTNLLFNQLSVMIVNRLRKNEKRFWNKTNMLVFSDLSFRMKDNARSFFLVAIITTVAFSAIGTLVGFRDMSLKGANTVAYDFYLSDGNPDSTDGDQALEKLEEALKKENVSTKKVELNPIYVLSEQEGQMGYYVVSESKYNESAKLLGNEQLTVVDKTPILLQPVNAMSMNQQKEQPLKEIKVSDTEHYQVKSQKIKESMLGGYGDTVVVSDALYSQMAEMIQPEKALGFVVTEGSYEQQIAVGKALEESFLIQSKAYMKQMVTDIYAPILFVGLFIGLIFFISAGSFLYFRLYSDMDMDKEKFRMVYKLGLSKKEMKKVVYQQVAILFFTPILVSTIHGAVALKAMYALFNQSFQATAVFVLGAFLIIQGLYYFIARTFYFKKLYKLVVEEA